MSTPTLNSAYPNTVSDLLPRARELAAELGSIPSRNRLMTEFRIGAPKANSIRDALLADADTTAQAAPEPTTERTPDATPDPTPTTPTPGTATDPTPRAPAPAAPTAAQAIPVSDPGTNITTTPAAPRRPAVRTWPLVLLALPAFVAVWSGWVGLGSLTGFGMVHPLPGIADGFALNSAITLPVGVETYAAFALRVWLSPLVPGPARKFARWSAIGSLTLGALGQVAYHVLTAAGVAHAPWWITTIVATLPVAVLGMGAALAHLLHAADD
ncbi:MAG TPA: ABC transporter permease [Micromonosporaceae bacterium]